MKFGNFSALLFLLSDLSFNLVSGKAINHEKFVMATGTTANEEKNDCTKFYNIAKKNNEIYSADECCSLDGVSCKDGHITGLNSN